MQKLCGKEKHLLNRATDSRFQIMLTFQTLDEGIGENRRTFS